MNAEKLKYYYDQMSEEEQDKFYYWQESRTEKSGYWLFVLAFALIGLLSTGAGLVYLVSKLF